MPKIHVVDRLANETLAFDSEKEIELLRIAAYIKHGENEDRPHAPLITVKLENGTELQYRDNGFDVFADKNRIVYAPVYDVETCEIEEYSMYEEEDIIGFVNRQYDYADSSDPS